MSRTSERGDAHGWRTFDNYVHVQDQRLDDFQNEGFVLDHSLSFRRLDSNRLLLEGRVWCVGNLFIDVETHLIVRATTSRRQVRVAKYAFHAAVGGDQDRCVFRYDNFHAYSREGHPDAHHKHIFDHSTWRERTLPEWIGEDRMPHLSDVIEELRLWWETTGQTFDPAHNRDAPDRERR